MRRIKNRQPLIFAALVVVLITLTLVSCREEDDLPPVITLNGSDSISIPLNSEYQELGAKVIDETEGDISSKLFIESNVNTDLFGEYKVTYKAIDESGNEAKPVYRYVRVINSAYVYIDDYVATETQFYPTADSCTYPLFIWIDSTVNWRIDFQNFACGAGFRVFADVIDSTLIIPFQMVGDSAFSMTVQGEGTINDSLVSFSYSRKVENKTTYWESIFERVP